MENLHWFYPIQIANLTLTFAILFIIPQLEITHTKYKKSGNLQMDGFSSCLINIYYYHDIHGWWYSCPSYSININVWLLV